MVFLARAAHFAAMRALQERASALENENIPFGSTESAGKKLRSRSAPTGRRLRPNQQLPERKCLVVQGNAPKD